MICIWNRDFSLSPALRVNTCKLNNTLMMETINWLETRSHFSHSNRSNCASLQRVKLFLGDDSPSRSKCLEWDGKLIRLNVHWTSTVLPSRTSYHPALCFSSSVIFLLVDACVGLNWLLVSFFLSHVNKNVIHSISIELRNIPELPRRDLKRRLSSGMRPKIEKNSVYIVCGSLIKHNCSSVFCSSLGESSSPLLLPTPTMSTAGDCAILVVPNFVGA